MLRSPKIIATILFIFLTNGICAQTLPVGFVNYENYLRRSQIQGEFDPSVSFNHRPLSLPDSIPGGHKFSINALSIDFIKTKISILSPQFHTEWNSHHPYYSNNGAMVPSKGFKSLTSVGLHIKAPFLSIQLRPEIYLSQNRPYDGFPDTLGTREWTARYILYNSADLPEQFGEGKVRDLLSGQSHALLTHRGIALGFSTENLWWGPGKNNSLLMSNNARSFAHLTFRTQRPLKTSIGGFEWQVIAGRLESSGFDPPERGDDFDEARKAEKRNDWRYLTGISFSYSPKWVEGLSIGVSRVVMQYQSLARETNDYFPVFINLFRKNDPANRDETLVDQLLSTYIRWFWSEFNFEMYFELGRNDAAFNLRDLLLSPQHSRAYTFGFSKIFRVSDNIFQFNYERTQMQQASSIQIRAGNSWYLHHGVRQGYTHRGEVLGSAIGSGSNLDQLSLYYLNGYTRLGLVLDRWAHDNDFHYNAFEDIQDFRRFWIDYSVGAQADFIYEKLMISGLLKFSRSLNYQWELHNGPATGPYFVSGRDVTNFHLNLKTAYLF